MTCSLAKSSSVHGLALVRNDVKLWLVPESGAACIVFLTRVSWNESARNPFARGRAKIVQIGVLRRALVNWLHTESMSRSCDVAVRSKGHSVTTLLRAQRF